MTKIKQKLAFTLVEVLAVVALIGILFVIFIPRLDFATDKTKETGVMVDFRSYQLALDQVGKARFGYSDFNDADGKQELADNLNEWLDPELQISYDSDSDTYKINEDNTKDPWGTPYRFLYDGDNGICYVVSAGPDKKVHEPTLLQDSHDLVYGKPVETGKTAFFRAMSMLSSSDDNLDNYVVAATYTSEFGVEIDTGGFDNGTGGNGTGGNGTGGSDTDGDGGDEGDGGDTQLVLDRIEVTKQPNKVEYIEGENFDSTGLEVTVHYTNSTNKVVSSSEVTVLNGTKLTAGQESVTIQYSEDDITKTADVTISVTGKISEDELTTYYTFTDDSETSGLKVSLTDEFKSALNSNTSYEEWELGDPMPSIPATYNGSNVTSYKELFKGVTYSGVLDLSGFDTSNVKSMYCTFQNAEITEITGLENWNTSNVTDLTAMFASVSTQSDIDLTSWDVSEVTSLNTTFGSRSGIKSVDITGWDTQNVTDMTLTFLGCNDIKGLEDIDVSNVKIFEGAFMQAKVNGDLDLSSWDMESAQNIAGMFSGFSSNSLILDGWNLTSLTSVDKTSIGGQRLFNFSNINNLSMRNWNLPKVTSINMLFLSGRYCSIDISGLIIPKVTSLNDMFIGCYAANSVEYITLDMSGWTLGSEPSASGMFSSSEFESVDLTDYDIRNDFGSLYRFTMMSPKPIIYVREGDAIVFSYYVDNDKMTIVEVPQ